jgi:hypothetical protein
VTAGTHTVYLYVIDDQIGWLNTPLGSEQTSRATDLGCRTASAGLSAPSGNWEGLSASGSTLTVSGWAFDPDRPATANQVHVYVDGRGTAVTANGSRPDVGAAFPAAGNDHGFSHTRIVGAGRHTVCVYAVDNQIGWLNTPLGCRTIPT